MAAAFDPRSSRGYLNNNPGNIDRSAEVWQGEIRDAADSRLTDFQRRELQTGRFCVFLSAQLGIRALAKNLFAYRDRLGRKTVRQVITTWAPPTENDTGAYVNAVARRVGVSPDTEIDVRDYKTMHGLVSGIIVHECGGMPYAGSEIEDGLLLAGLSKPVGVTTSATAVGLTAASTATIGGGAIATIQEALQPGTDHGPTIAAVQEPLRQAADSLAPMAGSSPTIDRILFGLKIALALVALVGIGFAIRERVRRASRDAQIAAANQENGL